MKTQTVKSIAALALLGVNAGFANADAVNASGDLVYSNRAYIHSIHGYPNPAAEQKSPDAQISYVNMAYGPAIYSYAGNAAVQNTEFNVRYVDTAYGPAIDSYPGNAPSHRLHLTDSVNDAEQPVVAAELR